VRMVVQDTKLKLLSRLRLVDPRIVVVHLLQWLLGLIRILPKHSHGKRRAVCDTFKIPIYHLAVIRIRTRLPSSNGRAKIWSNLSTHTELELRTVSRMGNVASIETRGGGDHKMAPWASLGLHDRSNPYHITHYVHFLPFSAGRHDDTTGSQKTSERPLFLRSKQTTISASTPRRSLR
jgi:hypothetical protein